MKKNEWLAYGLYALWNSLLYAGPIGAAWLIGLTGHDDLVLIEAGLVFLVLAMVTDDVGIWLYVHIGPK